jgi:hypothetical protein
MRSKFWKLLLLSVLCYGAVSCNDKKRFQIKTNESRIEVKINRFDQELIKYNLKDSNAIRSLYKQYPDFLTIYCSQILDVSHNDTSKVDSLFRNFSTDTNFKKVNDKVLSVFDDVSDIEQTISDAYTTIKHHFPKAIFPKIYFFVSGFNRSVIMNENIIGIGTDFYLGEDYPPYKEISYKYLLYNMRRECVATDIVSATLFRMFIMDAKEDRLLDHMLFRGKVMFVLSACMSDQTEAEIMGYRTEQMEWCLKYEKDIWGTIIDHKDLFSSDLLLIKKYLNEGPFTAPISQDSPGRLGTWIGLRIIESYMESHPKTSLLELMRENNYQKILQESKYRP